MSRATKRLKDYERWVLIGLVIILLATFSVTGAIRGCSREPGHDDLGGSYEAAPGHRVKVSDLEFRSAYARYAPIYMTEAWGPSLRYGAELGQVDRRGRLPAELATWQHIATVGAAEAAGYRVGDEELEEAVKDIVIRGAGRRPNVDPRAQGVRFTPELYDQVVQRLYRGTKADFEQTVREIVLKDKYLAPIVDAQRFALDRKDAYEQWKGSRERVDLQYAAVPASTFKETVTAEEKTRTAVGDVSARLKLLVSTALEVRRVTEVVRAWKTQNGDQWPADAADLLAKEPGRRALGGKMPSDAWGAPLAYARTADGAQVTSAGPDGKPGTGDDVGLPALDTLTTLASLQRVGDALLLWRRAAGSWPSTLADLTKSPPAAEGKTAPPPPLAEVPMDGWGRALAWDASSASLLSTGADGQKGTPDDLPAEVGESSVRVPAPASIVAYAGALPQDAWGRDLSVTLRTANPIALGAQSAGPDGKPGTADDVTTGNADDMQSFYNRVRLDFRLPLRREVEALYVIPALVPDEVFAAAWQKLPQFRPDDKEAWDLFRQTGFYRYEEGEGKDRVSIEAGDPKKGFAALLLEDLRSKGSIPKEATGWQVPAPETFGDRKDPAAPSAGGLPTPESDPLYKTYLEKGWRRVVLRDLFFEKLLAATLTSARDASAARKEWEKKGRTGPEPVVEGFAAKLSAWKDFQPGEVDAARGARFIQYFATKPGEPLAREDWEKLPELGDYALSTALGSLQDGDYAPIPTILREGALRAALHGIKRHDPREPELAEVREKVWPRYVDHRCMERAATALNDLRTELEKAWASGGDAAKPEARVEQFVARARDDAARAGYPAYVERTGLFVGSAGAPARPAASAGATAEDRAAALRRAYVRRYGYDQVRAIGSLQGRQAVEVGQLGRLVLRDTDTGEDGTGCAYLVQVARHAYPSPEEFHAGEYLRFVADEAYDLPEWFATQQRATDRKGTMLTVLSRVYDDWDVSRKDLGIETNRPIEMPKDAGGS